MLSTIRLFKALPVDHKHPETDAKKYEELMRETLPKGFIFDPALASSSIDSANIIDNINQVYGSNSTQLNASFHKSFAKVRDASMQQLVLEQVIHYITTYGAEHLGVYDEESIYIPGETLNAPELEEGLHVVVIRGMTKEELKVELIKLLGSGVALHERTVTDAIDVAQFVGFTESDIEEVKNKEVKAALYDYFGLVPSKPVEFLRFIVYRATEKTLLIKNRALIDQLKDRNNNDLVRYFDTYEKEVGLQNLAKIFYRYKPIFLALRTNTKLKKAINKIRRLADVNHEPMKEDLLNTITARLKAHQAPDTKAFNEAINNANIFRKIRLAYALKFRTTEADSIMYRIRNGKAYAKEFSFVNKRGAEIMFSAVLRSIIADIKPNIDGKSFFIPSGIKYALPATEKQFIGNMPSGSYVEAGDDMVVGIHWEDQDTNRIDLDLSISNAMGKLGWDGAYRSSDGIQFSGDVTAAPKPDGATEAFHINDAARGAWLVNLNYYNFNSAVPVPFKVFVAHDSSSMISKNYVVDPNKIIALTNSTIDIKHKTLGVVVAEQNNIRFYFSESGLQNTISAKHTKAAENARKFMISYLIDTITLNEVIEAAGGVLVSALGKDVVDLSPETLDKTTILSLLKA